MKLLVEELESAPLEAFLTSSLDLTLMASWLLHTELHCAASRHPDDVLVDSVNVLLDTVTLVDLTRGDLVTAGGLPGRLRSNDALHLAVALRSGAEQMLTYDVELAAAASSLGLHSIQPGG